MLESGFTQNPLAWLTPALGSVNALQPIDADPPNLKDEMCGPHRKRKHSEDEDVDAGGTNTATRVIPTRSSLHALGPAHADAEKCQPSLRPRAGDADRRLYGADAHAIGASEPAADPWEMSLGKRGNTRRRRRPRTRSPKTKRPPPSPKMARPKTARPPAARVPAPSRGRRCRHLRSRQARLPIWERLGRHDAGSQEASQNQITDQADAGKLTPEFAAA